MSLIVLAGSALGLGAAHGLGADHLMAIATLAADGPTRETRARALRVAVGFACGHAAVLGLGAVAAVGLGATLPASFAAGAERLGGLLLVVLGAVGAWSVASGRAYSHVHADRSGRARWHLHVGGPAGHPAPVHRLAAVPTAMGAVFALSSLRALMLLEPFGPEARALDAGTILLLVGLFGLGVLFSMSLFGVVLARVLSLRAVDGTGRVAALVVSAASMALGLYWLV
jgi:hypothetical protein